MAGTNGSLLLIRCKEHKTEVAFAPGGFFIKGSNAFIPTIIRLNEDQPINANWIPSNNGSAAFAPQAIDFIRSLSDGGKLSSVLPDLRAAQPKENSTSQTFLKFDQRYATLVIGERRSLISKQTVIQNPLGMP
jgi:hypothetical protein